MKKTQLHILWVLLVPTTLWFSCNPVKYLPKDEQLYVGGKVRLKNPKPERSRQVKKNLEKLLRPVPNTEVLGIRPKLFFYNISKKPTGKGLNYLLHEKWGEPPVLASSLNLDANVKILQNHLENKGYFQADVLGDSMSKKRKVTAIYTVAAGHRYRIHQVFFPKDAVPIDSQIYTLREKSLLYPGQYYSLDNIKAERIRIRDSLKNKGYFYFTEDDLIMKVDSTLKGAADIYVRLKNIAPPAALTPYKIRHVTVYPGYSLNNDSTLRRDTGYLYDDLRIVDPGHLYKPSVLSGSIFLKPGNLYTQDDHNLTLQRLVNMGTNKFVKVEFSRSRGARQGDTGYLNAKVYLTPYQRRSVRFELNGNSRSNNYVGSSVNIAWQDRNFLKGAELFQAQLSAGFETQVGGQRLAANTYSFSPEISLTIPHFITPFKTLNTSRVTVPRTKVNAGYELLYRSNYYALNAFNMQAGYNWKETSEKTHTLNVIDISYVLPSHETDTFQRLLKLYPYMQQSFQKQFILGTSYNFEYNDQFEKNRKDNIYFDGQAEFSGNLAGLLAGKHDFDHPSKIFGAPFAQYVKVSGDFRNYLHINDRGLVWVNRLFAGFGYSYGNSYTIPFVKQFFIGGSNSVRGFRARSLGPGSFHPDTAAFLANQAGDIKLEGNSELRFNLISIVKGAIFLDAGNIWMLRADSSQPGAQFHWSNIADQLAVSAGAGLRFDLTFFVLRFDLAIPLREPWLPEGQRWIVNHIDFSNRQWRRENLVLNIAIGYPF